jgi:Inner membrane protein YgaP-like, transmembrane domain
MTFNEGTWDRVIRFLVGLALGYAAWVTWPGTATLVTRTGIASLVYLIVGLEVLVTGAIGWSPLYGLFGWSTKAKIGA